MTTSLTIAALFVLLNIATFCVFWWDKTAAREGTRRVAEDRLLSLAFFGGSLGALSAQRLLRHKTRKEPFRTRLAMILLFHGGLVIIALLALPWVLVGDVFTS